MGVCGLGDQRLALVHRNIVPFDRAEIQLSGPANFERRTEHLRPMCDPARHSSEREQDRVHWGGNAHRFECDTRIKIDIGIKLAIDKVGLFPRNFF